MADLILVLILKPGEPGFIYHCQHGFMTPCWLVGSSLRPLAKGRAAPASSQTCRYLQYMDGEDGEDSEGFPSRPEVVCLSRSARLYLICRLHNFLKAFVFLFIMKKA